jgi:hypothetical protein
MTIKIMSFLIDMMQIIVHGHRARKILWASKECLGVKLVDVYRQSTVYTTNMAAVADGLQEELQAIEVRVV